MPHPMPEIHICREHSLGLQQARCIAQNWVAQAESDYGLDCAQDQACGSDDNTQRWMFSRSGVSGSLTVAADRFELQMKLGFLLGAFKDRIENEIQGNLDRLLVDGSTGQGSA